MTSPVLTVRGLLWRFETTLTFDCSELEACPDRVCSLGGGSAEIEKRPTSPQVQVSEGHTRPSLPTLALRPLAGNLRTKVASSPKECRSKTARELPTGRVR